MAQRQKLTRNQVSEDLGVVCCTNDTKVIAGRHVTGTYLTTSQP